MKQNEPELMDKCALKLEEVGQIFGSLVALDGISLSVCAGERRAVLGANGAGKTTLFNAITGDFPPTSGRIHFFGEEITHVNVNERIRKGLRRTYQKSLLFDGLSVLDNLYLAVRGVSEGRFSLKRPMANDPVMQEAHELAVQINLDDQLHEQVGSLSHGQQRQLEIGMAMAGKPKLILFDEPAAGLSPTERVQLVSILNGFPKEMTYLIVEHDLDIALKVSDYVTVMYNGKIFREGSPDAIKNDPDVQAIYLGRHVL